MLLLAVVCHTAKKTVQILCPIMRCKMKGIPALWQFLVVNVPTTVENNTAARLQGIDWAWEAGLPVKDAIFSSAFGNLIAIKVSFVTPKYDVLSILRSQS